MQCYLYFYVEKLVQTLESTTSDLTVSELTTDPNRFFKHEMTYDPKI